jgi:hypothetical protein
MARYEEVPGVGIVEFPDDTPQSVLDSAKSGKIGFEEQGQQVAQGQDGFSASRTAGILARGGISPATVAGGVGAAGAAAMGAPVAVGAGITALAGGLLELGARAYNSEIAKKYGIREEDSDKVKLPSEYLDQIKDLIGLPKAQTTGERVLEAGAETAGEAMATMGAGQVLAGAKYAPKAVKALGGLLKAEPAMQMAQSATGGMAQQAAEEAGAGGAVQTIAGGIGAVAPSIPGIAQAGARRMIAGGASPLEIGENIQTFLRAGIEPTVGQATGANLPMKFEALLGRVPGGASVMEKKILGQEAKIGEKIGQIAEELAPGAEQFSAGEKIVRGAKDIFLPQARKQEALLYGQLDKYVPAKSLVSADNSISTLTKLVTPEAGMEEISKSRLLRSPDIEELAELFNKQARDVTLPDGSVSKQLTFEGLKNIRSAIGKKLGSFQLDSDFPRSELKRIYRSLSDDMRSALESAGPEAIAKFDEASKFTKDLHTKIDILDPIIKREIEPEKVYQAAISGTLGRGQSSKLKIVMDNLPDETRREISSAFLQKMGEKIASRQDLSSSPFSSETFLTNWVKLNQSKGAKEALFGKYGASYLDDLDSIAKASGIIRKSKSAVPQTSGTTPSLLQALTIGGALLNPAKGILVIGGANLAAKAMTNPKFVRLLAKQYDAPRSSIPAFISTLATQSERDNDQELKDIADGIRNQAVESDLKR